MTKKSSARLARDELKQKIQNDSTSGWNDLKQIYINCRDALLVVNTEIVKIFTEKAILHSVPQPSETAASLRSLNQDIKLFSEELNSIYNIHKEKSGKALTPDDNIEVLKIFEMYFNYEQRYNTTVLPTVAYLAEQAGAAHQILIDKAKALGLLDPNVISDIEVKEKTIKEPLADENKEKV